jgi:hypothetical protein
MPADPRVGREGFAGAEAPAKASEPFCSDVAREERAPLGGTATRADAWLVVEHPGPWGERAVEENDLPAEVQAWLGSQVEALRPVLGKVRPLLARRTESRGQERSCFLAVAREERQELYRVDVARVEELARLDLAALAGGGTLDRFRSDRPLVLVCGNGRRDRCCARRGPATWQALAPLLGGDAWLSTHQGGHRYAATGLCLPAGVAYGFLGPEEAEPLAAAVRSRAMHLRCFRGRTFHAVQVQAADAMLRAARGEVALDAWRLAEAVDEGNGRWRVRFSRADGGSHAVRLRHDSEEVLVSCSPAKVKPIDRFTAIAIDGEESA